MKYRAILWLSAVVGFTGVPFLFINETTAMILFTAGSFGALWVAWCLRDV